MNVDLDTSVNALYLRLAHGRVAEHGEVADFIVADCDELGAMLGLEFVRAVSFGPYVLAHPEVVALPSRLLYRSSDRGRSWLVETGADDRPPGERARINAGVNGAFVAELVAHPSLIDRIPEGATVIPLPLGAPARPGSLVGVEG